MSISNLYPSGTNIDPLRKDVVLKTISAGAPGLSGINIANTTLLLDNGKVFNTVSINITGVQMTITGATGGVQLNFNDLPYLNSHPDVPNNQMVGYLRVKTISTGAVQFVPIRKTAGGFGTTGLHCDSELFNTTAGSDAELSITLQYAHA